MVQLSDNSLSSLFSSFDPPTADARSEKSSSPQESYHTIDNQAETAVDFGVLSPVMEDIPELNLDLVSSTLQDTANSSSGIFSNDSNELNFLNNSPTNSTKHDVYFSDAALMGTQARRCHSEGNPETRTPVLSPEIDTPTILTSSSVTQSSWKNGGSNTNTMTGNQSLEDISQDLFSVIDFVKTDFDVKRERVELSSSGSTAGPTSAVNKRLIKSETACDRNVQKIDDQIKSPGEADTPNSESDVTQSPKSEGVSPESKPKSAEKLGMSYITLLAQAILSCSEKRMVLSDIYNYILEHNPFFHNTTCAWRNSVRYTLSVNECFMKDGRANSGRGYYWAIHPACLKDFMAGDFNRRNARKRVQETIKRLEHSMQLARASHNQLPTPSEAWVNSQSNQQYGGGAIKNSRRNVIRAHPYSSSYASPDQLKNRIAQHSSIPASPYQIVMPQAIGRWDGEKQQAAAQWQLATPRMPLASSQPIGMSHQAPTGNSPMYGNQSSMLYASQTQMWSQNNSHGQAFYNN